jgi:hypothetical protein
MRSALQRRSGIQRVRTEGISRQPCSNHIYRARLLKVAASQIKRIVARVHTGDVGFKDQEVAAARKKLEFCKSKQHIWDELQRLRNIELPKIRDETDRKRQEYVRRQ